MAAALPVCRYMPAKPRNLALCGLCLLFYASFGLYGLPFLLGEAAAAYLGALAMEKRRCAAGPILILSLALLLGTLFVCKYLGFFSALVSSLARSADAERTLSVLLPAGLSFYTFQLVGYLADVYRGDAPAERNAADFLLFASFFPGLISGPIQRADAMLSQYRAPLSVTASGLGAGALRFLWGVFKKLTVADALSLFVSGVYSTAAERPWYLLCAAAFAYSVQIYCDFSAYSDMAVGSARMLGVTLPENFDRPYAARSVREFWRRWHISLSSWLRDYLYFPLGGSRRGEARTLINLMLVFVLSGLWHGAGVTFLAWGALHGLYQCAERLLSPGARRLRQNLGIRDDSRALSLGAAALTFLLVTAAWVFFRADSVAQALLIFGRIFSLSGGSIADPGLSREKLAAALLCAAAVFAAEKWASDPVRARRAAASPYLVGLGVFALCALTLLLGVYGPGFSAGDFIYFKF